MGSGSACRHQAAQVVNDQVRGPQKAPDWGPKARASTLGSRDDEMCQRPGGVSEQFELRQQPVTQHETDEWGEWRAGKKEEALAALQACAAAHTDPTDTAEGLFADSISEAGLVEPVAGIARTLLDLVARD